MTMLNALQVHLEVHMQFLIYYQQNIVGVTLVHIHKKNVRTIK